MACYSPIRLRSPSGGFNDVPCGKCVGCIKSKRSEWLLRLENEHDVSQSAQFITLTYDELSLPTTENGEPCFNKKHVQDFFKRLRHYSHFRYYLVSEYGGRFGRPHYHLLLFNFAGSDKDVTRSWWYGNCDFGTVTSASINYCAAYVITKEHYKYEKDDIMRPFMLSSRRPGLGHSYVDRMKNYHNRTLTPHGIRRFGQGKTKMPRFYTDKIFTPLNKLKMQNETKEYVERLKDNILDFDEYFKINPEKTVRDFYVYRAQVIENNRVNMFKQLKQNRDENKQNF